jgi:hypothetical protein
MKEFLEAINYQITGGSDYSWDCFGKNARYLDSNDSEGANGTYSITAVFDSKTQHVYCVEAWDYITDREYRWIDPEFKKAHDKNAKRMSVIADESMDGRKYIDLDVTTDILEKITAMVAGEEYDSRVQVPVNFSDEDLLTYMKLAHEMDITFNELVERAIKEAIEEFEADPKGFKARAKDFLNEDTTSE